MNHFELKAVLVIESSSALFHWELPLSRLDHISNVTFNLYGVVPGMRREIWDIDISHLGKDGVVVEHLRGPTRKVELSVTNSKLPESYKKVVDLAFQMLNTDGTCQLLPHVLGCDLAKIDEVLEPIRGRINSELIKRRLLSEHN